MRERLFDWVIANLTERLARLPSFAALYVHVRLAYGGEIHTASCTIHAVSQAAVPSFATLCPPLFHKDDMSPRASWAQATPRQHAQDDSKRYVLPLPGWCLDCLARSYDQADSFRACTPRFYSSVYPDGVSVLPGRRLIRSLAFPMSTLMSNIHSYLYTTSSLPFRRITCIIFNGVSPP